MIKQLITVGGIVLMTSALSAATPKKYGYVPLSFPRDPAEVNQFSEHIVLGQILEPVVDTDKFGNVTPGLAESWIFEDKGLIIRFKIRGDRVFSNGKKIESKDIKYTIERIIEKKAQSSNFLVSISSVDAPNATTLVIHLKEPNVSILKALSRDQMGVVPSGWSFDKASAEPIVGSGPYRLLKKGSDWKLELNSHYPGASSVAIKEWQLVFFADQNMTVPTTVLPDYASGITTATKSGMQNAKGFEKLKVADQISFAQTSAWWHPYGTHFASAETRAHAMSMVEELIAQGCKQLGYERATGVIPKGVAGHLTTTQAPTVAHKKSEKLETLRLTFIAATFDELLKKVDVDGIAKNYGFKVEIIKVHPVDIPQIPEKKPDIVFGGWAGGFNDPEGFIALLPTFLMKDFATYVGSSIAETYKKARQEQDWTARSALFQEINSQLRKTQLMVPGWRIPFFIAGQPSMISEEATFRYTPRLHTVKE